MDQLLSIEKYDGQKALSAVYYDGLSKNWYVKRFLNETKPESKGHLFITEHKESRLLYANTADCPILEIEVIKGKSNEKVLTVIYLKDFIDVKGWKAQGNRLTQQEFKGKWKDLTNYEVVVEIAKEEIEEEKPLQKPPMDDLPKYSEGIQQSLFD
jgi:topoisomerase-4 subunit A